MDQRQFEQAAAQVRRQIVAVAQRTGIDGDDAEDVAQDVMLRLWNLRADIDTPAALAALARRAARNRSIDLLRARRTVPLGPDDDRASHPSPHDQLEHDEALRWLEQRLAALPATQHEVLRLRQVERKTHAEIAAILGIQTASVATLLARARRSLLEEIRKRNES